MPVVPPSFAAHGYAILAGIFPSHEVGSLAQCVRASLSDGSKVMKANQPYAVRDALGEMPCLHVVLRNDTLRAIIHEILGEKAFLTKSIWFEKPAGGNWFVGWHQDISISVKGRRDVPGYSKWTAKHGVFGVVPPVTILERTLTVRIHLDDADGENGAVRVIPGSHSQGVQPPPAVGTEGVLCAVPAGGVMLMRPLLLHASSRARSTRPRRVLHMEFNELELEGGLEWAERIALP